MFNNHRKQWHKVFSSLQLCHYIIYQGQTYSDGRVDIHRATDVNDVQIFLVDACGEYFPR